MTKQWLVMRRLALGIVAVLLALPALGGVARADETLSPLATNPIDTSRESSLTIVTQAKDGAPLAGVRVAAYRVAGITPTFPAAPRYAKLLDSVGWSAFVTTPGHSAEEWDTLAATLRDYVVADGYLPTAAGVTGADGQYRATTLLPGIYLVIPSQHVTADLTYTYAPALVGIPGDDGAGGLTYDVVAQPKFTTTTTPSPERYRVVKQWNDRGRTEKRPSSITVDIYADGVLHQSVQLSAENNWSYSWAARQGVSWNVVERVNGLPYTVANTRKGETFIITNSTKPAGPPTPPEHVGPPKSGVSSSPSSSTLPLAAGAVALLLVGGKLLRCRRVAADTKGVRHA